MHVETINFGDANAGEQLVHSLHNTGFAVLTHHPIPGALLGDIYADWHQFFSSDEKHQFLYDPDDENSTKEGFHPQHVSETAVGHSAKDIKEFYHLIPDGRIPPALKEQILEYRSLAMNLGTMLLDWIQQFTPADISENFTQPLPDVLSSEMSLLRILHYPPITGGEAPRAERAAPHEDINLLTILPVADQPGLQVKRPGGEWLDVASVRGSLIINTGDMLLEASAGYYPSTTHRVINPQDNSENVSRLSMPFFLAPRTDFVLSERYTAGRFLEERLRLITR